MSAGSNGPQAPHASSYIVNDTLAVDAGPLGFRGTPADQVRTRPLLISHCHSAFPDHTRELAELSMHLTPDMPDMRNMVGEEARELQRDVPLIALHVEPRNRAQIVEELGGLVLSNLELGCPGRECAW